MKILDMIKRLFNKNKALPEGRGENNINTVPENRGMFFQREDGSSIELSPCLDRVGNQVYVQIYNARTNEMQLVPKFDIYCEELKTLVNPQILKHSIYMDVDYTLLQEPYYANYVVNNMLSSQRMEEIILENKNYAGSMIIDKKGDIEGYYQDQGIIDSLNATKEEYDRQMREERIMREIDERLKATEYAQQQGINYKTSHAEDLSKYNVDEIYSER